MKLLVAALDSELQAFPSEIDGYARLVTGPGKLKAAVGLTQALERAEYDEILVLGTAGTVDESLHGRIHEIGAAVQHDVWDGEKVIGNHVSMPARLEAGREGTTIATGDHFVDTAEGVARVLALGASLIDMETYAYLYVAAQYGVPIRVFRAVSDAAEEDAYVVWDEVVAECSAQLWAFFQSDIAV